MGSGSPGKGIRPNIHHPGDKFHAGLAALELGEATMQDLARKSKVKRTSIYNFIDKLKEGLMVKSEAVSAKLWPYQ